jgi:hypothetical protein
MTKKSRKARRGSPRTARPVRIARPSQLVVPEAPPQKVDFSKEYHYVIEDLRRIAITALALLVLLIVLAIVLG